MKVPKFMFILAAIIDSKKCFVNFIYPLNEAKAGISLEKKGFFNYFSVISRYLYVLNRNWCPLL